MHKNFLNRPDRFSIEEAGSPTKPPGVSRLRGDYSAIPPKNPDMQPLLDVIEDEEDEEEEEKPFNPNTEPNKSRFYSCLELVGPFSPKTMYMYTWDSMITLFFFYNSVFIPFRIGFNLDAGPSQVRLSTGMSVVFYFIDYIGDALFLLDIMLRSRLQFRDGGDWIKDTEKIFKYYFKSWFLIDIISSIPLDIFIWDSIIVHYCVRLTRLLRLPHIYSYFRSFEVRSTRAARYLFFKLVVSLLVMCHWLACGYFGLAYYENAWGQNNMLPPASYLNDTLTNQYIMSYWWAVHVLTRFGGTVNDPVTILEMIFMTIVALFAFYWIAIVIGAISETIGSIRSDDAKQRSSILSLKSFMKSKDLPEPLQRKIVTYFDHVWSRYHGWDEDEILSWLPSNIKTEVNLYLSEQIITKIPLFDVNDAGYIKYLCSKLSARIFIPGDWIVNTSEVGDEMFIISGGSVDIFVNGTKIQTLHKGDYFGEIVLLYDTFYTFSAQAKTFCDTLVLTKKSLASVLKFYPEHRKYLIDIAEQKIASDLLRNQIKNKQNPFFAKFTDQFCDIILDLFKVTRLKKGEVLYSAGEFVPVHYVFVGKGQLRVTKNNTFYTYIKQGAFYGEDFVTFLRMRSKDKQSELESSEVDLSYFGPEVELKNRRRRYTMTTTTTLLADTDSIILYLPASDFYRVFRTYPNHKDFFNDFDDETLKKPSKTSLDLIQNLKKQVSSLLLDNKSNPKKEEKTIHLWLTKFSNLVESIPELNNFSTEERKLVNDLCSKLQLWNSSKKS
uniref:Cyclic nucleotide-binding domain-containing protein n=1 Tax=Arcella intermedia TaxID=1963864 RepID=A0A6B2KY55_9EUKA